MNIQRISVTPETTGVPAFKASYVTLSEKNLGRKIATYVVDTFNSTILPKIRLTQLQEAADVIKTAGAGRVISVPEDFQNKVNFFALAAG